MPLRLPWRRGENCDFPGRIPCWNRYLPKKTAARGVSLKALWRRRQGAKFNGVSYITQRAAEAALSEEGMVQNLVNVRYYMQNAAMLRAGLEKSGVVCFGGFAPYVWARAPEKSGGEKWCETLLYEARVAATPGGGFGKNGKKYVRFSAFCPRETIVNALENIAKTM